MTVQFLGPTVNARVRRIRQGVVRDVSDVVTTEEPLEIRLLYRNGYEEAKVSVSVTMRTPRHDYELAAGFLYTEGIINDLEEAGYVTKTKTGRQNSYQIHPDVPLKDDVSNAVVGELLVVMGWNRRRGRRRDAGPASTSTPKAPKR